jgi:hypothetical protein
MLISPIHNIFSLFIVNKYLYQQHVIPNPDYSLDSYSFPALHTVAA